MEFFTPSDSHGLLLLLYFPFLLMLGKCLLYTSTRCLWNVSKVCCVSLVLLISSQLMLLMGWQKFSLFWKLYNYLNICVSFSLISICLAMRNIGKWSDIWVMDYPCTELFISPISLGKKHCVAKHIAWHHINKLGSLCMAFIVQNINVIISKKVTGFIFPPYYIYNVNHIIIKGWYMSNWWTINYTNNHFLVVL